MQTEMSGVELLEQAKAERAKLAALWRGLSDAQMTCRPGPQADWSVKDVIAHIVWWEDAMLDLCARALTGADIVIDGTVDDANASAYAEKRDISLAATLADWQDSLARVEVFLAGLSDEQINDSAVCQIFGNPLRRFIVANTSQHYADHIDDLRAYVKRLGA